MSCLWEDQKWKDWGSCHATRGMQSKNSVRLFEASCRMNNFVTPSHLGSSCISGSLHFHSTSLVLLQLICGSNQKDSLGFFSNIILILTSRCPVGKLSLRYLALTPTITTALMMLLTWTSSVNLMKLMTGNHSSHDRLKTQFVRQQKINDQLSIEYWTQDCSTFIVEVDLINNPWSESHLLFAQEGGSFILVFPTGITTRRATVELRQRFFCCLKALQK
jgi:hypothetical protein